MGLTNKETMSYLAKRIDLLDSNCETNNETVKKRSVKRQLSLKCRPSPKMAKKKTEQYFDLQFCLKSIILLKNGPF